MFQFTAPEINESYKPELKRSCLSKDLSFSVKFDFTPRKVLPLPLVAAIPITS